MKYILIISLTAIGLVSCKSGTRDDAEKESAANEAPAEVPLKDSVSIFQSNDLGATEYLKLIDHSNGEREWLYWTAKKTDEIPLGVKTVGGFECLYFKGKAKELYEITGSECGFSLFQGEERLQWYDQIQPACTTSMD